VERAVNEPQLSIILPNPSPIAIQAEVKRLFLFHYDAPAATRIETLFSRTEDLFAGRFPGYRHCNTEFHNFAHTTDTFLAVMRIIDGYNLTEKPFPATTACCLLAAALFHDSGYLQKDWDTLGTGAKYTREHVSRSKEFVAENAMALDLSPAETADICLAIDSTEQIRILKSDSGAPLAERMAASLLGAADLVAQLADRVYVEKLLFLYYEFREAGIAGYETEFDIIRRTLDFYELVRSRLEKEFGGVHHYAAAHFQKRFGTDRDLFAEAIERNIKYVRAIIADDETNFRAKLKRSTD
jgi:hypothetical protein